MKQFVPDPDAAGRGSALPDYLTRWFLAQRWYAGKGHTPALRSIGRWALPTAEPGVSIHVHLVLDTTSANIVLYQVPLTERTSALPDCEPALIASVTDAAGLTSFVYDAPHDPAYGRALLDFMLEHASSPAAGSVRASAHGETLFTATDAARPRVVGAQVLTGEQSNTSIILDTVDDEQRPARPLICKVFRAIHHGENPDVSVQSALARAGSRYVPEPVGCVVAEWDDPGQPTGRATGHLAFVQEFLPGVEDAWRVALHAAETGEDFSERARQLGEATADVHADLVDAFPTREATPEVIATTLQGMADRYRSAVAEVPALAEFGAAIEAVYARTRTLPWPRLQRIHGDYHLGQVLAVPGRGWVLLDFEGEPLRPMHERDQPEVPLRDIAGMLRSFSYAAGTVALTHPEVSAAAWESACRRAFLAGYANRSGLDLRAQGALVEAFELDKAVYETVYESRNRPDWLPIPLNAVRRLVAPD